MTEQKRTAYKKSTIFPAVFYGAIAGALSGAAVVGYKFLAGKAIHLSETGYAFLRENMLWVIPLMLLLGGVAAAVAAVYKRLPTLRGGGIPTSIAALRGTVSLRPLANLVGTVLLSLLSFVIGVPLGNEGPAVQIGTALGKATTDISKKGKGFAQFSMTGGASAGFATATGAPVSGVLFALEEVHGSFSPMMLVVSAAAVLCARLVTVLLCPLIGVSEHLIESSSLPTMTVKELWIPLLTGVAVGAFAVLFLWFYRVLHRFCNQRVQMQTRYKLLIVYALTMVFGLLSFSFVSTGHHLIETLFLHNTSLLVLVALLLVRTVLTLTANCNGVTGGLFLPTMALGALLAAVLGNICVRLGMDPALQTAFVLLGITASLSGMMRTPLIAVAFSIEALSLSNNLLAVLITVAVSYAVTVLFKAESIVEYVTENHTKQHQT